MMYKSQAYCSFIISSREGFDLDSITSLLNLQPTDCRVNQKNESIWEYKSEITDALEGVQHEVSSLIEKLQYKASELGTFVKLNNLYAKLFVVIQSYENESNGFLVGRKLIDFLSKCDAEIEIDIYPYD